MQSTAFQREPELEFADDLDREGLARDIASLREDVCSVSDDIRRVLEENAALKQEIGRLRQRRRKNESLSELRRLKGQLDRMIDLHDVAAAEEYHREPARRPVPADRREDGRGDWMKKMMIFMMLSEMV